MAKKPGSKSKLLLVAKMLMRYSDEDHILSMAQILEEMDRKQIPAERKSIYKDIDVLRDYGMDIQVRRSKGGGWFLGEREFQLPELKLLVDAVQSSRFLSKRKSEDLISKLEGLASVYQAKELHRSIYIDRQVKTMNESIFYNVDKLQTAIASGVEIRFRYFDYNARKEKVYRHDGRQYRLSPVGLIYDNENYYMVGWDEQREQFRHYRVDKMADIIITESQLPHVPDWDPEGYTSRHFGMFSGDEGSLQLRCENRFASVILDRFGMETFLMPDGPDHFIAVLDVVVSPQFWGWLVGLGDGVEILAPSWAVRDYRIYLKKILALYEPQQADPE